MTHPATLGGPDLAPGENPGAHPQYLAPIQPVPSYPSTTTAVPPVAGPYSTPDTNWHPAPAHKSYAELAANAPAFRSRSSVSHLASVEPQPVAPVSNQLPFPSPKPVPAKKRSSRGALAAIVVLSLLTAAALGLGGYFWFAADRWTTTANAWEEQARTHGTSVADLSTQLAVAQAELATLQEDLASAQTRITELANERAQLGDQQVMDQNRIDFQARLSTAAANVASSLDLCITRQDELIEALRNPGRYTEESVARFGEQVVQFCNDARKANTNLQTEINR